MDDLILSAPGRVCGETKKGPLVYDDSLYTLGRLAFGLKITMMNRDMGRRDDEFDRLLDFRFLDVLAIGRG